MLAYQERCTDISLSRGSLPPSLFAQLVVGSPNPHRDQFNRVRLVLVGFSVVKRLTLWFFHQVMMASTYILAPEGRQVYRNSGILLSQAPEGRQVGCVGYIAHTRITF